MTVRAPGIVVALAALALAVAAGGAPAQTDPAVPRARGPAARPRAVRVVSAAPGFRLPLEPFAFEARETDRCLRCHGQSSFMVRDSASGEVLHLSVDPAAYRRSRHAKIACTDCHPEIRVWPHTFTTARAPVACDAACHARDARGRPVRHDAEMADYRRSAHRGGMTGESPASPVCTTCHGDPHTVTHVQRALSRAARMDRCGPCHDDREKMIAAKVDPDAVAAYRGSFHYKAIRLGSTRAAVCQDCHGVHRVIAVRDTASSVAAAHLPATCGQTDCHRGASPPFAMSGANHLRLRVRREPLLAAFEALFVVGGAAVLVLLAATAALDAQRRFLGPRAPRPPHGPLVRRLTPAVRLQHGALMAAFILLALTGIPLRFADVPAFQALHRALGGVETARIAHRAAGVLLALTALAHLAYAAGLLVRARGDVRRAWSLLPARSDLAEASDALLHAARRRPAPPAHGRHHFREKIHYLAVCWGVPVMIASGAVLWFPVPLARRLPDPAIGMAILAHGDEALAAIGVVIVWHLYVVHVMPWPHHRFLTWLDGRVHHAQWVAEHGREAAEAAAAPITPAGGTGGTA